MNRRFRRVWLNYMRVKGRQGVDHAISFKVASCDQQAGAFYEESIALIRDSYEKLLLKSRNTLICQRSTCLLDLCIEEICSERLVNDNTLYSPI